MTDATIHSRALLVSLSISTWTARKFDRKVTEEVNAQHAAARDAGRYNKMLLPGDADSYKALTRLANAARADHYANTLPWSDEGWRLLPSANYMKYADLMRTHAAAFESALESFVADYPAMKEAARDLLNGMYREQDYPTTDAIRSKFRFGVDYAPLPAQGDFRLDLPAAEIDAIESRVQDRVRKATAEAMRDAWGRLHDVVSKMHDRLSQPDAIFRDTLVGNVRDLVDVLSRLNVTDDPSLEALRARVQRELAIHEPQTLRADGDVREATAKAAQDILDAMSEVYGGAR